MNSPHLIAKAEIERRKREKAKRRRADATALHDMFGIDTGVPIFTDAELKSYVAELSEWITAGLSDTTNAKEWDMWKKLSRDEQVEQVLRMAQAEHGEEWVRFRERRARLKSLSFPELCELANENGDFLQRTRFSLVGKAEREENRKEALHALSEVPEIEIDSVGFTQSDL